MILSGQWSQVTYEVSGVIPCEYYGVISCEYYWSIEVWFYMVVLPVIFFYSFISSTYKFCLTGGLILYWDWVIPCLFGDTDIEPHGSRFMIREISISPFLPVVSRNHESPQIPSSWKRRLWESCPSLSQGLMWTIKLRFLFTMVKTNQMNTFFLMRLCKTCDWLSW
jgi:hypothetical protein